MSFKVLLSTAGVGSRLGEHTTFTNKALLAVGDEPVISRIINSYPDDVEFVITLGYHGDQIRQFLGIAFPERDFQFVEVDNFDGPGSSLGYSMLCARDHLQCPFVYQASDTLVFGRTVPAPDKNWMGGHEGSDSTLYASFDSVGNRILATHDKGMDNSDYLYLGMAGIHSFEEFWDALVELYSSDPQSLSLNDVSAIRVLLAAGVDFFSESFPRWYDIGNIAGLQLARAEFDHNLPSLDKRDEAIFKMDTRVFKFFADEDVCTARVQRSEMLAPHVPLLTASTPNWYSYPYVEGEVLGNVINTRIFGDLLEWAQRSFWQRVPELVEQEEFRSTCRDFYMAKSHSRVKAFVEKTGLDDTPSLVNGLMIPSATELLHFLEDANLIEGQAGLVHGDFILDNIVKTKADFIAIDWRQSFGNLLEYGDVYYDLAKLNHSLTMNHEILNNGQFEVSYSAEAFSVGILRKSTLLDCEKILRGFVEERGYDYQRVRLLTPLIWINMAALHPHPMDIFLFQYGRYRLAEALEL